MKSQELKKIGFILLMLIFISGCGVQQFKTDLFSAFEQDTQVGPTGLAWDGKNVIMGTGNQILFARNIVTEPFYRFSKKDTMLNGGSYTSGRFPGPQRMDMDVCGMAWEGECCGEGFLWIADGRNDKIIKMKPDLTFVSEFKSPVSAPNGIAFDGKSLWIVSKYSYKIVQFNPDTQSIANVYYSPIQRPTGLTWDCSGNGYIWVIGIDDCRTSEKRCYTPRLLRLDVKTGNITHEAKLPETVTRPTSVELAEKHFWVGDYNLNRVFKIPFDESSFIQLDLKPNDIIIGNRPNKVISKKTALKKEPGVGQEIYIGR
ncbi:MAG: hypothetical protein HQK69_03805 [Desulfamplus sp.]|nr:hypothetical protein [Desulfamplus sp.]